MCPSGEFCLPPYFCFSGSALCTFTKRVDLVQSWHHHHIIKCSLYQPCCSFREKFEDTKGVISSHQSKKIKHSDSQKRTKVQTILDIVGGKDQSLIYSHLHCEHKYVERKQSAQIYCHITWFVSTSGSFIWLFTICQLVSLFLQNES